MNKMQWKYLIIWRGNSNIPIRVSFLWCLFEGDYIIIPIYKGSLIQTWCLLLNLWYLHLEQPLEKGMCIVRSESSGESSIEKNIILNRINYHNFNQYKCEINFKIHTLLKNKISTCIDKSKYRIFFWFLT